MAKIIASFAVHATTTVTVTLDVKGMSPDDIAEALEDLDPYVSVCHQCAQHISGPERGELDVFAVDGVKYIHDEGRWQRPHSGLRGQLDDQQNPPEVTGGPAVASGQPALPREIEVSR